MIAADGGAAHAQELGLTVNLVVGDLDSVPDHALGSITSVERHPIDKDATDLELALVAAARLEPERIIVLGGARGRLDHLLGGLLLLAKDEYRSIVIDAQVGEAAAHVIRGRCRLDGEVGELISLFALNGPAVGIWTEGLKYPLADETLEPGSTRGVSNVFAGPVVFIGVERGVLLAVRPSCNGVAGKRDRAPS